MSATAIISQARVDEETDRAAVICAVRHALTDLRDSIRLKRRLGMIGYGDLTDTENLLEDAISEAQADERAAEEEACRLAKINSRPQRWPVAAE